MTRSRRTYTDRFGLTWDVDISETDDGVMRVTFTCDDFRLVLDDLEGVIGNYRLTDSQLKELFCDAERVLEYDDEVWYVGYRHRSGRGGRQQGGLSTRFRSDSDEVRYSREMLLFRQMDEEDLRKHLDSATTASR